MARSSGSGSLTPTREAEPLLSHNNHSTTTENPQASEATPLIPRSTQDVHGEVTSQTRRSPAASLLRSLGAEKKSTRRWPSLVALLLLCVLAIMIMVLGFLAPDSIHEYAVEAATFEPTSLSIQDFNQDGVLARVQGDFSMDSSKVKQASVRNLGKFGTWIATKVQSGQSFVEVSLPEYSNVILGTARVPPIIVNVRDGHTTHVDFVTQLTPGDSDGIRKIAKDWVDGKLGDLRVVGKAKVPIESGLFSFGKQVITHVLSLHHSEIPTIPEYTIKKLNFHDFHLPNGDTAVAADTSVLLKNKYPVDIRLPPLGFEVLVGNCSPDEPRISLAYVSSTGVHVTPKNDVKVDLLGVVRDLPPAFTAVCPKGDSPMDTLLGNYIHGQDATVYVRGSSAPSKKVPKWITELISEITVPVSVPGHTFGQLVKNFTLANVHFSLPNPMAEDGTPESDPSISATIKAVVSLPEEMNFNLSVEHVRADADVYYKGRKLGKLDLQKWQNANSTQLASSDSDGKPELLVQSMIQNAPLKVTDDDVFTDVIQALLFGRSSVMLGVKANVDVQLETALGKLTVRKIPAEGRVPVKPIGKDANLSTVKPKISQLQILDTSKTSLTIHALLDFINPTEYHATIPYADIHITNNGSLLGHATIQTVAVKPGKNIHIPVMAVWEPQTLGGDKAHQIGVELLSQYISGYNTTITLRTHEGSIPTQPGLGRALSNFTFELPTPRLFPPLPRPDPEDPKHPKDDEEPDDGLHFISDATMHLLSSSATFTLTSPLRTSTLFVTYINATALYKGDEVGHIDFDEPFEVPPSVPVTTPPLPVDWSVGSVGFEAIRRAVGGRLKLAARATVGLKIGLWEERIWYVGRGIGAKIRL